MGRWEIQLLGAVPPRTVSGAPVEAVDLYVGVVGGPRLAGAYGDLMNREAATLASDAVVAAASGVN